MPRKLKIEGLNAEIASLDALLRNAREYSDAISEYQLSRKKAELENELSSLMQTEANTASVALLFAGSPVIGSRGISADFAGNMLEHFQNLVARTFAAAELGVLGERGPVPMRQATDLMVTNLARGSFGFVLNELSDQGEIQETALKTMVGKAVTTISLVSSENELEFEEVVDGLDGRSLISLREFFKTLDISDATIRLVDDASDISLDSTAIRRARFRVESTSIDETEEIMSGVLEGFLPEHRKFELRRNEQETLYGSVSKEATEQYASFVGRGEPPMHQMWRVRVTRRTVRPLNRPAKDIFRLLEFIDAASA